MIVCSKRAFLNVVTQLFDRDTLLNANYYILDHTGTVVNLDDYMKFNPETGEYEPANTVRSADCAYTKYFIKVDSLKNLDPTPFQNQILSGSVDKARKEFINFINQPSRLSTVLKLLATDIRGNGLQICIMYDFQSILYFGDIICEYLAKNFGYDVILVDAVYHSGVKWTPKYAGDAEFSKQMKKHIYDYDLVTTIQSFQSQSYSNCKQNLESIFFTFSIPQILYVHQLLYPDQQLPWNNLTREQLIDVLIEKITYNMERPNPNQPQMNMWYSDETDFNKYIDQY